MVTFIGGIGVVSVVYVVVQKRKHDNVNNDDNFALLFMLSCFISDGHGGHIPMLSSRRRQKGKSRGRIAIMTAPMMSWRGRPTRR